MLACVERMDHSSFRPGMVVRYDGRSRKVLHSITPPGKGAAPQRVGEIDKVLRTGGVVLHVDVVHTTSSKLEDDMGEEYAKGESITRRVGIIVNAHNLTTV